MTILIGIMRAHCG